MQPERKLISVTNDNPVKAFIAVERQVNTVKAEGYVRDGSIFTTNGRICQAMVLPEVLLGEMNVIESVS